MNELYQALAATVPNLSWLEDALHRVAADPAAIRRLFPAAGRHCGRDTPLPVDGWVAQDAARAQLLAALPQRGEELAKEVDALYRYGDAAEKRAVLKALPMLCHCTPHHPAHRPVGDAATELLRDAIRTNDTRLVAAALGPYAAHLDQATWRQAVLKCVFMGIPLAAVHGLAGRADAELAAMLAGLADERRAAGRTMPADALALMSRWE